MVHMFKLDDSLHVSFCFCSYELRVQTRVLGLIASVLISWIYCYSHRIYIQVPQRYKWVVIFLLHKVYWTKADMSLRWFLKLSEIRLVNQPGRTIYMCFLLVFSEIKHKYKGKECLNWKKSQDTVRNPLHK